MIPLPIAEPEPTGCQTREELLTRLTLLVYPCTPSRQRAGAPGANCPHRRGLFRSGQSSATGIGGIPFPVTGGETNGASVTAGNPIFGSLTQ